jgi:LysR family transcriptional regulator for metE and metH
MSMDLEIRHLRLVTAIAEEGGVTRAGVRLHLTQSALSHQLRDIESRLGAPLFLRLKRRMVPTPAGERLLASARAVLERVEETERAIRRGARRGEGLLRLAVECTTCYHWLPALLEPFHRRFPHVEVRIAAEETHQTAAAVLEGRLDLALVSGAPRHARLRLRPLFEDEMVVVMHPAHPLAARPFVRPHDVAPENLFMYTGPEDNTAMQRVFGPAGVAPRRTTKVILTEAILQLVAAGQGIAVLSSWSVAPAVDAGLVLARRLTRRGLMRRWQSARRREPAPDWLVAFEDLLAKHPPASARLPASALRPAAGERHRAAR